FQRTALGLISNVLLNCLLIPKYGALGAAYATVVSFAIAGLFYDLLQKETRKIFLMKVSALNVVRLIGRVRCLRK
ncbi:polysaccharide biosynthesis C-terminal domain-containing protein, partial [Acinetobacter baumannii]